MIEDAIPSDIPQYGPDEWDRERLKAIEEPLAQAYEQAVDADEAVEEEITADGLSDSEVEALWELYARYESWLKAAAHRSYYATEGDIERDDVMAAVPAIYLAVLGDYCHRDVPPDMFQLHLWQNTISKARNWIGRRAARTGGSAFLARVIRREDEGRLSPRELALELEEKYDSLNRPRHILRKIRVVRSEQPHKSLNHPTTEDSDEPLHTFIEVEHDAKMNVSDVGRKLAELWGREELWETLTMTDRTWTREELEELEETSAAQIARRSGRTKKEVRTMRRAMGIDPPGASYGRSTSKLSDQQVEEIRERYESEDLSHKDLSQQYPVSESTIGNVLNHNPPYDKDHTDESR